jgi:hypothetical protein
MKKAETKENNYKTENEVTLKGLAGTRPDGQE